MGCTAFHVLPSHKRPGTPNLPTKIIPTKICWLKLSGKFPKGLEILPLKMKILLEPNPLKSRILVLRLAVSIELSNRVETEFSV